MKQSSKPTRHAPKTLRRVPSEAPSPAEERAGKLSEEKYRALVENINDVHFSVDAQGRFDYVSPAIKQFARYEVDEIVGQHFAHFVHPDDLPGLQASFEHTLSGSLEPYEFRIKAKDGALLCVRTFSRPLWKDKQLVGLTGVMMDITERRRTEDALQKEHAELEQWVKERTADLAQANRMLNILSECNQAVARAREEAALLQEICRIIVDLGGYPLAWIGFAEQDAAQTVRLVAQAGDQERYLSTVHLTWADSEHGQGPTGTAIRSGQPCIARDIQNDPYFAPWRKETIQHGYASSIALPLHGNDRVLGALNIYAPAPDAFHAEEVHLLMELAGDLAFGIASLRERAARSRAEVVVRESEVHYRAIVEAFDGLIYICSPDYRVEFMNKRLIARTGYDGTGKLCYKVLHERDTVCPWCVNRRVFGGETVRWEVQSPKDEHWYDVVNTPIYHTDGSMSKQAMISDITERKRVEEELRHRLAELEALHTISVALRTAQSRDEALPIWLNETLAALETDTGVILLYYPEQDELRPAVSRGWFLQVEKFPLKPGEGIAGEVFASGQAHSSAEFVCDPCVQEVARSYIPAGWGGACVPIRAGMLTVGVMFASVPLPRQLAVEQVKLLEALAEIGGAALHRMSLHEETVRQLEQLQTLRLVDRAITASMDLGMTLDILLEQVIARLKVDAADVYLLNPRMQTLEFAAGRGFYANAMQHTSLRLGDRYAGQAVLERKIIHIPDLCARKADSLRLPGFLIEGFVNYYGIPLISKGQVKGVLEVFQRAPLAAGTAWLNFFEMLAGQAAIAIDNAQLFENLQRSNMGLALAYDATIEGWSKALDLRDRETEGHTLRVTEMTLQLARAAGIADEEVVHVRRGALLHDIGKMGVPDAILLKPDKLTQEEWGTMHKHPIYAYEMLSSIAYLRPALAIPYCHHEKWDGSGYPRGLKCEEIPLAARLFAVIDVYDALTSDRLYRAAWSREKTLEYIESLAGSHFDPNLVGLFLKEIEERG